MGVPLGIGSGGHIPGVLRREISARRPRQAPHVAGLCSRAGQTSGSDDRGTQAAGRLRPPPWTTTWLPPHDTGLPLPDRSNDNAITPWYSHQVALGTVCGPETAFVSAEALSR